MDEHVNKMVCVGKKPEKNSGCFIELVVCVRDLFSVHFIWMWLLMYPHSLCTFPVPFWDDCWFHNESIAIAIWKASDIDKCKYNLSVKLIFDWGAKSIDEDFIDFFFVKSRAWIWVCTFRIFHTMAGKFLNNVDIFFTLNALMAYL